MGGYTKMDLQETGYKEVEWLNLAQDMDQERTLGYSIKTFRFQELERIH